LCGIVGYTGKKQAKSILLSGLDILEYRGYDSAGICIEENGAFALCKASGKLERLREKSQNHVFSGTCGIGHTRWATHGAPTEENAHPHLSSDGSFSVVHNGIVENAEALRAMLKEHGFSFRSDTDTEVVPQLMQYFYRGNVQEAFLKTVKMLSGSYALCAMSTYEPGKIFAAAKESPLLVAKGADRCFVASDAMAFPLEDLQIYSVEAGELAVLSKNGVLFQNTEGEAITKQPIQVERECIQHDKSGYDFFMLKEIMEQPAILAKLAQTDMGKLSLSDELVQSVRCVHIIACGSAYHAGLAGKRFLESLAGVPTFVETASEFRYRSPVLEKGDLVIAVSQSGETADTIAAFRYAKEKGAATLSVVNVRGSTLAREADGVLYTDAGPEIAVATTKAYTAQVLVLYQLSLHLAEKRGRISPEESQKLKEKMKKLPQKAEKVVKQAEEIRKISEEIKNVNHIFFIGRGADADTAAEGALKLKEITYIHAEAYAAGELKHGTISLMEEGTPVIAIATQKALYDKMRSNIQEVKARGARVYAFTPDAQIAKEADYVLYLPDTDEHLGSVLAAVSLQLLSYYTAIGKGLDADKPRNLAKSVTVE